MSQMLWSYMNLSYSYSLKLALPPRRSFAITRTHYLDGAKIQENYKDNVLTTVNELFHSKVIDYNLAFQKLEKHLAKLKADIKPDYIVDDATKRVMSQYLAQRSKDMAKGKIRPTTFEKDESEILLLQELLKGEDVLTIDDEAAHDLYSARPLSVGTKNKLMILTNRLRRLAGVTVKVSHFSDKSILGGKVDYINKEDTETLLQNSDELDFHIIRFAIATGLREGELFGIEKKTFRKGYLDITRQMYRDGTFGNPKNNRRRTLPLNRNGEESYKYLMANFKHFLDQRRTFSNKLRRNTIKILGHAYSTYDLRHTYAINCLQINIGPLKICGWMGNSVTVLQNHYIGFMVDATEDDFAKINSI